MNDAGMIVGSHADSLVVVIFQQDSLLRLCDQTEDWRHSSTIDAKIT